MDWPCARAKYFSVLEISNCAFKYNAIAVLGRLESASTGATSRVLVHCLNKQPTSHPDKMQYRHIVQGVSDRHQGTMTLTRHQAQTVTSDLTQGQLLPFQSVTCRSLSFSTSHSTALSPSAHSVNVLPVVCVPVPLIDRLESSCLTFDRSRSLGSSVKHHWYLPSCRNYLNSGNEMFKI